MNLPFPKTVNQDCRNLIEVLRNVEHEQSFDYDGGYYSYEITLGSDSYQIECDFEEQYQSAEYEYTDRGRELVYPSATWNTLTNVNSVKKFIDDEWIEIYTDQWTNQRIIDLLNTI